LLLNPIGQIRESLGLPALHAGHASFGLWRGAGYHGLSPAMPRISKDARRVETTDDPGLAFASSIFQFTQD